MNRGRLISACVVFGAALFLAGGCASECEACKDAEKSAGATPAAVNTVCPYSGHPVDQTVTASYGGKTMAFCCQDCKDSFNKLSDEKKAEMMAAAK